MRCAKGITLEVGQTVSFDTWDHSDPLAPRRISDNLGIVTKLDGEVARNQTLGEVTLTSGNQELTFPAGAVTVIPSATPAAAPAAPAPAKRKSTRKKK